MVGDQGHAAALLRARPQASQLGLFLPASAQPPSNHGRKVHWHQGQASKPARTVPFAPMCACSCSGQPSQAMHICITLEFFHADSL